MAATNPLTVLVYVGPFDEVEVAGMVVKNGGEVEVPAVLAGEAPSSKSPGSGLLAQPDNWTVKES